MKERAAGRSGLSGVRRRLRAWREQHGGRGRAIPAELWDEAVALARTEGVERTARELGVDRRRLTRLTECEPPPSACMATVEEPTRTEFVELDTRMLLPDGRAVVQLEGRDGERVRIEVSGVVGVDVLAVARAFWGRAR